MSVSTPDVITAQVYRKDCTQAFKHKAVWLLVWLALHHDLMNIFTTDFIIFSEKKNNNRKK